MWFLIFDLFLYFLQCCTCWLGIKFEWYSRQINGHLCHVLVQLQKRGHLKHTWSLLESAWVLTHLKSSLIHIYPICLLTCYCSHLLKILQHSLVSDCCSCPSIFPFSHCTTLHMMHLKFSICKQRWPPLLLWFWPASCILVLVAKKVRFTTMTSKIIVSVHVSPNTCMASYFSGSDHPSACVSWPPGFNLSLRPT